MTGILPLYWTKEVYPPYSVAWSEKDDRAFDPNAVARGSDTLLRSALSTVDVGAESSHLFRFDLVRYVSLLVCPTRQISGACVMSRSSRNDRKVDRTREQRDLCRCKHPRHSCTRRGTDVLAWSMNPCISGKTHLLLPLGSSRSKAGASKWWFHMNRVFHFRCSADMVRFDWRVLVIS